MMPSLKEAVAHHLLRRAEAHLRDCQVTVFEHLADDRSIRSTDTRGLRESRAGAGAHSGNVCRDRE
jgi:hypothetical protein